MSRLAENGGCTWYACKCCPYGYHIDLDFVRYCESIRQPAERSGSIQRRKDRRRQRQSMEMLLGLSPPDGGCLQHFQDDLGDVMRDFERTLQHSNAKIGHNLPDVAAVSERAPVRRVPSLSSISSTTSSSSSMTILQAAGDGVPNGRLPAGNGAHRDFDTVSIESTCSLSPTALHTIREQMALSLERTKELEEVVKMIPALKSQIAHLERENTHLASALKRLHMTEVEQQLNVMNSNYLDNGTTPPPAPRRDCGVSVSVLTRNIGVGHHAPQTRTVATAMSAIDRQPHVDRWFNEKNRFLNGDAPLQVPAKMTRSAAVQTSIDARSRKDSALQVDLRAASIERAVNAVVVTKSARVQCSPSKTSTAVSDDTIDGIICPKCRVAKASIAVNTHVADAIDSPPISLAALATRSKSFNLGESKLGHSRLRSVGCQHDFVAPKTIICNKLVQTETKTASKHSQYEPAGKAHKSIQSETDSQTKSTDTAALAPVMKQQACETMPTTCSTVDVGCNTNYDILSCPKCSKELDGSTGSVSSVGRRDECNTPSRIPRLQAHYSPVENRTFKRQETYTKIPADTLKSASGLSALELVTKPVSPEISPIETGKQKCKFVEVPTRPSEHEPHEASASSSSPPTSPHKKRFPSKEMQAAMKVLNDSLQKQGSRGAQLKNANAIIEQEWFKVSSVVHADPLDVEDYLDAFEDVSAALLQHVVNMVDASGNTAMHYAVSHGNFDVVSILLDSKVCDINRQNKAGYTSVMLVSLAEMRSHTHANVVRRLFSLSDVNIRAKQHGQTALMLAVSHGRLDMVAMLLEAGADINIQDEDGSTALMCAAEHGHIDIVRHFLSQSECDTSIKDVDGSTALQIAMEAEHRHIGVLLYAHNRNIQGGSVSTASRKKSKSTSGSPKLPASPLMQRSHRALSTNK